MLLVRTSIQTSARVNEMALYNLSLYLPSK